MRLLPPWRRLGAAALRVLAVWVAGTVTMLVLAAVLPDFRLQQPGGDSATRTALTAALGAGTFGLLSALVWPLLVRAMLLVPALVLGLLVFFLNGSLLWLALVLIPERGDAAPETAVVVAAAMSAASSATSGFIAVRDDAAYRRRLMRLTDRRRRREGVRAPEGPGVVFLQLDGLGYDVLQEAVGGDDPLMPAVADMSRTTHRLTRWETDWSSQTGASQLAILHGTNHDVPAFRWYEKDRREVLVSNRPSSAAELQRRAQQHTGERGLLAGDGASRGNLFSGGARQLALVLSVAVRRGRGARSRAGYFAYFADPANATRTALSFVAEVVREVYQSSRSRLRRRRPRVGRGGLYPFLRAFATVVQRDVVTAAVLGDVLNGRAAVYADLVAYDEVAHHSGPRGADVRQVLRSLDRSVALIAKAAEHAPRPYRLVLLSDHGQSEGEPFRSAYGLRLEDLVRAGCGLPVSRRARATRSGAEARAAARAALRRPEYGYRPAPGEDVPQAAGPIVLGSGNLGLVSFPDVPGRMTREEIDDRHPALLRTLTDHPGIGFLLVHSAEHGAVVLGAGACENRLDRGEIVGGRDPLEPFGPYAADTVLRTSRFPHAADIMVNSSVDPETGHVHAFEDQVGSHGGLGGEQSKAFLLSPLVLSAPAPADTLVGAEEVHRVLRGWIDETRTSGVRAVSLTRTSGPDSRVRGDEPDGHEPDAAGRSAEQDAAGPDAGERIRHGAEGDPGQ